VHDFNLSSTQSSEITAAAEQRQEALNSQQECPLCRTTGWTSRRAFVTHVGKHLETIALASLPREAESDFQEEGVSPPSESDEETDEDNERLERTLAQSEADSAKEGAGKGARLGTRKEVEDNPPGHSKAEEEHVRQNQAVREEQARKDADAGKGMVDTRMDAPDFGISPKSDPNRWVDKLDAEWEDMYGH